MSLNTFGHLFRVTTWGESHGPALGATVDGCPPGIGIDEAGLHTSFGEAREGPTLVECDHVVLCAGQESERSLADTLIERGRMVHVIGGADVAAELDAKRAIDQGTRLAAPL